VFSTARVYAAIDGKILMVRINRDDATVPSEAELRALWDKQVKKLELTSGSARSTSPKTP
jgi:hypothetical protein